MGTNRRLHGDLGSGRPLLEQALGMYRALQDRPGIAGAAVNLAGVLTLQKEHRAARALMQEALEIFRQLGDSSGVAWSLNRLGDIAYQQGPSHLAEARRLHAEAAEIFRSIGDRWGMASSYSDLGFIAYQQNELIPARELFVESLKTLQTLRHTRGMPKIFECLACLAVETADFERALTLVGAAAGLRDALGSAPRAEEEIMLQEELQPAWEHLDASCARNLWTQGFKMPPEDAIRYALEPLETPARPAAR
jgi:tetratricopeptide (TPR) repeat protein